MKTIWQILSLSYVLFHVIITFSKLKNFKVYQALSLFVLFSYLVYPLNINWGRYLILLSYLSFVFLLLRGSSARSVIIMVLGFLFSWYDFFLGYSIIVTTLFYWISLRSKDEKGSLIVRYFLLGVLFEVCYLSFGSVSFLWCVAFLASRFYSFQFLNLIMVSHKLNSEGS